MKHARPAWAKKLNRSVTHRLAMKKTMLTQLVLHERLTTTLAKAQFIQHDAERLIDAAKTSTPAQLDLLASQLRQHDQTLPKMRQVLAQRYRGMDGGYTRLLRAGFDPADKSPVAILEFVGNPQDTVAGLASLQLPALFQQLRDVERQRYAHEPVTTYDPRTGAPQASVRLVPRADLSDAESRRLKQQEVSLRKAIMAYQASLDVYDGARRLDGIDPVRPGDFLPLGSGYAGDPHRHRFPLPHFARAAPRAAATDASAATDAAPAAPTTDSDGRPAATASPATTPQSTEAAPASQAKMWSPLGRAARDVLKFFRN